MNVLMLIIHIVLLLTFPICLVFSIPLHILISIMSSNSKKRSSEIEDLKESIQASKKHDEDAWVVAQKHVIEVKSAITHFKEKAKPEEYDLCINDLKTVYFSLGAKAIDDSVVDSILREARSTQASQTIKDINDTQVTPPSTMITFFKEMLGFSLLVAIVLAFFYWLG
ncbi:hypothetical protein [Vibrio barjaei]|uniref:hypothetical protein n=1 Tax=Vibrio barjaei TaxID=1676683 RepID=UPI0022852248|nr:hypothetical protein [Vibrio barjaei]MCY9870496.1 hypothetical protein [Vibrio barjaei]